MMRLIVILTCKLQYYNGCRSKRLWQLHSVSHNRKNICSDRIKNQMICATQCSLCKCHYEDYIWIFSQRQLCRESVLYLTELIGIIQNTEALIQDLIHAPVNASSLTAAALVCAPTCGSNSYKMLFQVKNENIHKGWGRTHPWGIISSSCFIDIRCISLKYTDS